MKSYNLVLVARASAGLDREQLGAIANRINATERDVQATVVGRRTLEHLRLLKLWNRPTLVVSFLWIKRRGLLPGRIAKGAPLGKDREYQRFREVGIPVPDWIVIEPDTVLDAQTWGPYVVEKPAMGFRGANIRVRRTTKLRYRDPAVLPQKHFGRKGPMLAQRLVYTGQWPTSYRVHTLFGEVLLCYRQVTNTRGNPLNHRWDFGGGGVTIVSNTMDMKIELVVDQEVIALSEKAHRSAFPGVPALAFDIVRDVESGELFVLESHPQGHWILNTSGQQIEAAAGVDFAAQFKTVNKAAKVLARETRLRAEANSPFAPHRG
ncbi:MAG: hypothetical protein N2B03_06920 [Boseongicola sp.]